MIGFFMGGSMLSYSSPFIRTGLRNFFDVLSLTIVITFLALIWSYFLVVDRKSDDGALLLPEGDMESDEETAEARVRTSCCASLRSLFEISHIRDIWKTVSRARPDGHRRTFHALLLALFLVTLPTIGTFLTIFPLTERLYKWDYETYSFFQIVSQFVRPVVTSIYIAVIVKGLALQDLEISVIGILSSFLGFTAIASIPSSTGFYIQIPASSVGVTASAGVRAFLTRLIPSDEMSKVVCIMLSLETIQPFVASYFMSSLFKASIDYYPTLALHAASFCLLVSLIIVCVIDVSHRMAAQRQPPPQPPEAFT